MRIANVRSLEVKAPQIAVADASHDCAPILCMGRSVAPMVAGNHRHLPGDGAVALKPQRRAAGQDKPLAAELERTLLGRRKSQAAIEIERHRRLCIRGTQHQLAAGEFGFRLRVERRAQLHAVGEIPLAFARGHQNAVLVPDFGGKAGVAAIPLSWVVGPRRNVAGRIVPFITMRKPSHHAQSNG